jgi:hypothetical protein
MSQYQSSKRSKQMNTVITTRTHQFTIKLWHGAYEAHFRPINQKNGKPWQASHRIDDGADIRACDLPVSGYSKWDRKVAYSTEVLAIEAINRKANQLAKR